MTTHDMLTSTEQEFLDSWEEIYKRGHLTLWVLISLWQEPLDALMISQRIHAYSDGHFSVTEQSLYRALRRFYDVGLVDITKGKDKRTKHYRSTPLGNNVLRAFVARNIVPLHSPILQQIIKEITL